jgi:hypothetical protein
MTGSLDCVLGVLGIGGCSQQLLDEALETAAMLGRYVELQMLLEHGADPAARGAAALAWAKQCQRQPQALAALQERFEASGSSSSTTTSSSSGVGNLAVAAWCLGLQHELSGLKGPDTPPPHLQSLQQFLRDSPERTVANLMADLQREWPELFVGVLKQRR